MFTTNNGLSYRGELLSYQGNGEIVNTRVTIIDSIRGIACLLVVIYHFVDKGSGLSYDMAYISFFHNFRVGVQAFFVISGFVILHSLYSLQYDCKNILFFIKKRIIRLEPPYLVSLLVSLALIWVGSMLQGTAPGIRWWEIIGHVGYLNGILGYDWIVPAYWTLAIEFQFYLFMALVFPLFIIGNRWSRIATLVSFLLLAFVFEIIANPSNKVFLFQHAGLFSLGIVVFWEYVGLIQRRLFWLLFTIVVIQVYFTFGFPELVASVFTALAILVFPFARMSIIFQYLGAISYSLYLIHQPIGYRVINVFAKLTNHQHPLLEVLIGIAGAIVAGHLLYVLVEKLTQDYLQKVRIGNHKSEVIVG